jgi:hypothetical protein
MQARTGYDTVPFGFKRFIGIFGHIDWVNRANLIINLAIEKIQLRALKTFPAKILQQV